LESVSPSKPRTEWAITGVVFGTFAAIRFGDKCGEWANYAFPIAGTVVGAWAGILEPHAVEWTKECDAKDDPVRKEVLNSRIGFAATFVISIILILWIAGTQSNRSVVKPVTNPPSKPTANTTPTRPNNPLAGLRVKPLGESKPVPTRGDYDKAMKDALDASDRKAYEEAGNHYTNAAKLASQLALPRKESDALTGRGIMRLQQNDRKFAKLDFDDAIKIDPTNPVPYACRANAYTKEVYPVDLDAVIKDTSEAIRLDPEFAWAYYMRSSAHAWKGNHRQAVTDAKEARRLDPKLGETAFESWTRENKPKENPSK
jgi:hypothetical protein